MPFADDSKISRWGYWHAAAMGMVAGVCLTLTLGVFSDSNSDSNSDSKLASKLARGIGSRMPDSGAPPFAFAAEDAAVGKAGDTVADAAEPEPEPDLDLDLDQDTGALAGGSAEDELDQGYGSAQAEAQLLQNGVLSPPDGPDTLRLALLVDRPVEQYVAFWLDRPRRLVVDVPGRRSGFAQRAYTVDHPLVSLLRIGEHPDKVRFVLEASDTAAMRFDAERDGAALVVELRR